MADPAKPLLIKRYASRRLYNTETSDYVTLDDIAGFIRAGREVSIIDLKSGDDLTRQYLLQIIAEHEAKGDSVLPVNVLTDLVRSYTTEMHSMVPQFLAASFEMLRNSQSQMMENMGHIPTLPGFDTLQRQQEAFLKTMMTRMPGVPGWPGTTMPEMPEEAAVDSAGAPETKSDDLAEIKQQLAALQAKLAKL